MGAATNFPAAAEAFTRRGKMSRSDKRGSVASPQAMTEGVIIGSAAFCESAALRVSRLALSVKPCRACQLSQRESQEHCQKLPRYT